MPSPQAEPELLTNGLPSVDTKESKKRATHKACSVRADTRTFVLNYVEIIPDCKIRFRSSLAKGSDRLHPQSGSLSTIGVKPWLRFPLASSGPIASTPASGQ